MTRNWYAVYTRPERGKKIASSLTRKGIRNYFPESYIVSDNANKRKSYKEALFCSHVFVYISEIEMEFVKNIPGVVNFLYWHKKPSIINAEEIEAIKQLTSFYFNIRLEKSPVNLMDAVRVIDEPVITFKENSASIRFQTLKIVLPSLGFTMIAERNKVNELILQQELAQAGFNTKRENSFYSN